MEGQPHEWECEYEECPLCGEAIWGPCYCADQHFGLSDDRDLTDDEIELWHKHLEEIGRVPHLDFPQLCTYCGKQFPDFFMVPDDEWRHYVPRHHQGDILCETCYEQIKEKIDKGKQESPAYGEIPFPATAKRELYKLMFHLRGITSLIYVMSHFDESLTSSEESLLDEIDCQATTWIKKLQRRFAVKKRRRRGKAK